MVEGAKECPDTSDSVPGNNVNSVPGDLLPEVESSTESVQSFGEYFALIFVTLSCTLDY